MDRAAFLVTAAHVARAMDADARIFCGSADGRRWSSALADLLSLRTSKVPWTYHARADVAAVRIPKPSPQLRGRFLPAELLWARKLAPSGALDLVIMGFPLGLFGDERFAPLTKRAHAASGIVRIAGAEMRRPADFFMLDQPAMGGYSGGPVFVAPQLEMRQPGVVSMLQPSCIGVVSQTISDGGSGQFAMIVPAACVRSVLVKARG
jgi:hypothetical protein